VVVLKSGSHPMTVHNYNRETGQILVIWFDDSGDSRWFEVNPEVLEFAGPPFAVSHLRVVQDTDTAS
jgi:uncharacterized protein YodC (DUF2158 family)